MQIQCTNRKEWQNNQRYKYYNVAYLSYGKFINVSIANIIVNQICLDCKVLKSNHIRISL